jgi:hypothetical protein
LSQIRQIHPDIVGKLTKKGYNGLASRKACQYRKDTLAFFQAAARNIALHSKLQQGFDSSITASYQAISAND